MADATLKRAQDGRVAVLHPRTADLVDRFAAAHRAWAWRVRAAATSASWSTSGWKRGSSLGGISALREIAARGTHGIRPIQPSL